MGSGSELSSGQFSKLAFAPKSAGALRHISFPAFPQQAERLQYTPFSSGSEAEAPNGSTLELLSLTSRGLGLGFGI